MTATVLGRHNWEMNRTREGNREYTLTCLVESDYDDGPAQVMQAVGLPTIGTYWSFGNDADFWAFCTPDLQISYYNRNEGERHKYWTTTQVFSTRPIQRCQDSSIEDPLMEPPKISGSFNNVQKEIKEDRNGSQIKSSSHEQITGIMKDDARPSVIIEWNSASLDLDWIASAINTLNDGRMWGLAARKIKLSNVSWSRQLYGLCNFYYTKRLEFEVRFDGFDSDAIGDRIMDTGFRCLRGKWVESGTAGVPPTWEQETGLDETNPDHYIRVKDCWEDPAPMRVPLDGHGGRLTDPTTPVFIDKVELYAETNFLAYGIPAVL
jgi:hypothetical protein